MSLSTRLERAWIIGCSRCANEGQSYAPRAMDAAAELAAAGWTEEGHRAYCPPCSDEVS